MNELGVRVSYRTVLFAATLLLAIGMRVAGLGAAPLSDSEAREALWAAEGTPQDSVFWPHENSSASSAIYQSATWGIFQLGGAGDASARLVPAVVGALIVLPPWFLRRRFGSLGALTASFLLAISPTLVAVSRTAGGSSSAMVAVCLGATAVVLALDGDWRQTSTTIALAVGLGVGLTSGPTFYLGLCTLFLAAGLMLLTSPRPWSSSQVAELKRLLPAAVGAGVALALVIAFAGGWLPRGGTAIAESLRQWLVGWIGPGAVHAFSPTAILVIYEPLILVFGIAGAVVAWRSRDTVSVGLAWWAALALLAAILYPARSGATTAWCTIPLACLAGMALAREAEKARALSAPWHAVVVAALLSLLLLYAGVQLASYASGIGPGANPLMPEARLAVAAGAIVVAILSVVLIGLGWSWEVSRSGLALGGAVLLLILTLSSAWRLDFVGQRLGAGELWEASSPTYGIPRIASTVASLAGTSQGVRDELPLAIVATDPPPSLLWALRAFPRFTTSDSGVPDSPPLVVARADGAPPELRADYLGQTISIGERWDFRGPLPPNALQWWWRRRVPVVSDDWLLLVRADLATLGQTPASGGTP